MSIVKYHESHYVTVLDIFVPSRPKNIAPLSSLMLNQKNTRRSQRIVVLTSPPAGSE